MHCVPVLHSKAAGLNLLSNGSKILVGVMNTLPSDVAPN